MREYFILGVICYILGILSIKINIYFALLLFIPFFYLLGRKARKAAYFSILSLAILLFFYGLGMVRTTQHLANLNNIQPFLHKETTVIAYLLEAPEEKENSLLLRVKTSQIGEEKLQTKLLVTYENKAKKDTFHYGQVLKLKGKLELPKKAKNPLEFDYREYLLTQGITAQTFVKAKDLAEYQGNLGNPIIRAIYTQKNKVVNFVNSKLPRKEADLFNSINFGDKGLLKSEQQELFSALGIMHIFAVSGSNVAAVLLFVSLLAIILKLKPTPRYTLLLLSIFYYAIITGLSPSVLRACLMAAFILFTQIFLKEWDVYLGLAAAALVLSLYNPLTIFEAGFILSFLVTWGLVYFYPLLKKILSPLKNERLQDILSTILAAQLAVFPLSAYLFNSISIASPLVNLLVVPFISLAVILGVAIYIFILLIPPLAVPLLYSAGFILKVSTIFLEWMGQFPWIEREIATPNIFLVLFTYFLLIALTEKIKAKNFKYIFSLGIIFFFTCFLYGFTFDLGKELEITFLDVGQGDAIFIKTPTGERILLDGGGTNFTGSYNAGEKILLPYLKRRGIKRIDYIFNSHPDSDHLAGLMPVIEQVAIRRVFLPPSSYFKEDYQALFKVLNSKKINYTELRRGNKLVVGKVLIEVLHPQESPLVENASNNNSLVLAVTYKNFSALLTGDIEPAAMEALKKQHKNLISTVLKIPHHGSKYSFDEEFYRQVSPKYVIYCVGKNNFGHPAPAILEYWEQRGIKQYRTDWDGAIRFYTDGETLKVKTMGREIIP